MLRLRNRILPLLRAASPLHSPIHPRPCCLLSTSPVPFSLEDYLVSACGLAPAQAGEVSKKAFRELARASSKEEISRSRLYSASNPDAVIALLAGVGLSRADIAAIVSADPLLLRADVNNIASRLSALRDRVGLSTPQIVRFLLVGSDALRRRSGVVARLEFFISFYGSFEKFLMALKWNTSLLSMSIERTVKPNIALLHQWGVSYIPKLCSNNPSVLTFNLERLKECLIRAEEIGVPRTSRMFKHTVAVTIRVSKEKLAAKLEFFKRTLGCSESEVSTAVSKKPGIIVISEEILLRKIEFLVNEAAFEPKNIVERPVLLTYSLEKRLVPRYYVMKVLQEKGSLGTKMSFYTLAS